MSLIGFTSAAQDAVAQANASKTIAASQSPFIHGVRFTVSGYGYRVAQHDDAKQTEKASKRLLPVLEVRLINANGTPGITCDLFVSMLTRLRVDENGNILTPSGTLNEDVRRILAENAGKTNGEILSAIVAHCSGKTFVVERTPYVGLASNGNRYPTALVNINEVK